MELLKHTIDIAIISILGLMGFLAILFTLERMLFLRRVRKNLSRYPSEDSLEQACTNNLTTLYIIYSNAPYVGLLGTVVGIMITFYDMGKASSIDASAIMTGLSLALYATALGLVVAIPTLIAYNALNRKVAVLMTSYKHINQTSATAQQQTVEVSPELEPTTPDTARITPAIASATISATATKNTCLEVA